jgi:hypothetical protein
MASPAVTINSNNVRGNATVEASAVEPIDLAAASTLLDTAPVVSATWPAPAGTTLLAVRAEHAEVEGSVGAIGGQLETGSGTQLAWFTAPTASRWCDLSQSAPTSLRTRVLDYSTTSSGTTRATRAVTIGQSTAPIRPVELTAVLQSGTVDARGNYWGAFPDVLPRIVEGDPGTVDFTGCVGTPIAGTGPQ